MEQTLGRRISSNRKRLGLTQDALAERLGITAQAISKWENDLSCPDITMLPKLAEIFDISTDELLGVEPKPIVYESEIVEEPASEGGHVLKGNCEIHWDNSKKDGITLAVGVLMVGTLYLLSKWFQWDVSFLGHSLAHRIAGSWCAKYLSQVLSIQFWYRPLRRLFSDPKPEVLAVGNRQ